MPSTYSNIKIQLMGTGENTTTWGDVTNVNLGTAIEEAIVGSENVTFASANVTLTLTNTNATQVARHLRLRCTGTTAGARDLIVPSIEKPYIVRNDCADTITVKTAAGTGIAVPAGRTMWVYSDGVNVVDVTTHLSSLTLTTALPVLQGGTGSTTASGARTNLGATTVGGSFFTLANPSVIAFTRINADNSVSTLDAATFRTAIGATTAGGNFYTLTNPSAIAFPRINADNTVSTLDAATFRTAIGAGTSSTTGTVTSVGMTVPAFLSVTPASFTTSGTFAVTLSGTALPIANGGTGSTATAYCSLASNVTGTLPVANGGTGQTTYTDGQLLIGNTASTSLTRATLTAGTGISITNGNGSISIAATGGTGTVTSVSFTGGIVSVANPTSTPAFTVAGTSGGVPYFSSASTWATSGALAANAIVVGGGAGGAPATITTGTGVVTALGVAVGTAGAFVVQGGALGTPLTGNLANCTFPTLNQNTTGSAATLGTARTITIGATGRSFDGSANISWTLADIGAAASGANTDITALNQSVTVTASGAIAANSIGYRGIPQNAQTSAYTLALADAGRHVSITTGGVIVPANGSVAFPIGTAVTVYNNSGTSQTISITTDTMYLAGTATTGTRTLAQRGVATILKVAATEWVISGGGLT
jgi:hypothetical protein